MRLSSADRTAFDPSSTIDTEHLTALEAEAVFIFREVVAEAERPGLLFSGGKDSIVMLRLAQTPSPRPGSPSHWCTRTPVITSPR